MEEGEYNMMNLSLSDQMWNMTEQETHEYLEELSRERTYDVFLPAIIFVGCLGLIGLIGNTLVLIVYIKYFKHNPSRVFIISLAVFDLVSNVLCIPGDIIDISHSFSFPNSSLCKFFRYNNFFATIASVLTLVAISVERYKKICRPLDRQLSEVTAYKTMGGIVLLTLIVSIPSIIFSGLRTKQTPRPGVFGHDCTFSDKYRGTMYPKIYLAAQFLVFVICAVALIVLYSLIGVAIYKQKHKRLTMTNVIKRPNMIRMDESKSENSNSTESMTGTDNNTNDSNKTEPKRKGSLSILSKISIKRNSEDKTAQGHNDRRPSMPTLEKYKTTFMLLTITIAFILSYLPYLIISIVKVSTKDFEKNLSHNGYIAYTIFLRSFFINAAINSIIYSFWNQTFRDGVKKLLQRKTVYVADRRPSQLHSF